ncbi:opine dehydrogenase-like [Mercenaria mercenaria]|uniref:opine dehydrogenase-like n=1 Tax=Mercenaria mercenaria TaxID=6596 RepID=UPI00234F4250|nr:opine dehydrogenase-like [Mercenaria mercenaria]XP_045158943.2 opine dehydrogenase-like [Mercenaria mercenaria]XP_045158944.2 opine dehydrogenase-like [Mercenaria mercenaria]XP_045158945.2 opine dehydrogenase-like [Mercenaria mercenaria]
MEKPTRILICGGGNGAHCLAVTAATLDNVEVNILTLFADEAKRWSKILGEDKIVAEVTYSDGKKGEICGKPRLITDDPTEAMKEVDAVFFVVPAFAHQQYFDAILKHIRPNTIIVGMPGQAGFEFQAFKCLKAVVSNYAIISMESLPWACRTLEFGRKVQILGYKDVLGVSLVAGKGDYKLPPLQYAQKILGPKPHLKPTQNYLAVNLMAKSIVHPPVLYGKWRNWDGNPLPEAPLFYQGVDDDQEYFLTKVSDEVLATAAEIHKQKNYLDMSEVIHIYEWYKEYYKDQISDNSSLKACMKSNGAYDGLVHPMKKVEGGFVPDFKYRYLAEDIPFGLVVIKGIAECVGVKTPTIDTVIAWGQEKLGKEYIDGSALTGKDVATTRAPQAYEFKTLEDLCGLIEDASK